jgi:hypothetical protein
MTQAPDPNAFDPGRYIDILEATGHYVSTRCNGIKRETVVIVREQRSTREPWKLTTRTRRCRNFTIQWAASYLAEGGPNAADLVATEVRRRERILNSESLSRHFRNFGLVSLILMWVSLRAGRLSLRLLGKAIERGPRKP